MWKMIQVNIQPEELNELDHLAKYALFSSMLCIELDNH